MTQRPQALILRAPGTNCDLETDHAFCVAGAETRRIHVQELLASPSLLNRFQILCLPGGFSYGDDIAAGRILARQLSGRLAEPLARFRDRGHLILAICNGFQVVLQTELLVEGNLGNQARISLAPNRLGRFEARWVHLEVGDTNSVFLRGIRTLYLPVAHAEGRVVACHPQDIAQLTGQRQVALRYVSLGSSGNQVARSFPCNPNGSIEGLAGISDASGRVLGLMPHPERHVLRTQHPRWTRESGDDVGDGLRLFQNAVQFFSDS